MNRARKHRLIFITLIISSVAFAAGLVLYALQQNINLFYSPSQVVARQVPVGHIFRLGGLVENGSIRHLPNSLQVVFVVTDHAKSVTVNYTGILPDLFREGQSVVVEGKLDAGGMLIADQVLAKHDERYMPKQVATILEKGSA